MRAHGDNAKLKYRQALHGARDPPGARQESEGPWPERIPDGKPGSMASHPTDEASTTAQQKAGSVDYVHAARQAAMPGIVGLAAIAAAPAARRRAGADPADARRAQPAPWAKHSTVVH